MKHLLLYAFIFNGLVTTAQEPDIPENSYLHYKYRMFCSMAKLDAAHPYQEARSILLKAVAFEKNGMLAEAIDSYKHLMAVQQQLHRDNQYAGAVPERIARLYAQQGMYRQALVYYDSLVNDYPMHRTCGNGYDAWLEHVAEGASACFSASGEYDSIVHRYTSMIMNYNRIGGSGVDDTGSICNRWMAALKALHSPDQIKQQFTSTLNNLRITEKVYDSSDDNVWYDISAPFFSGQVHLVIQKQNIPVEERRNSARIRQFIRKKYIEPLCAYQKIMNLTGTAVPECTGNSVVSR